jgi:hypothetical protein
MGWTFVALVGTGWTIVSQAWRAVYPCTCHHSYWALVGHNRRVGSTASLFGITGCPHIPLYANGVQFSGVSHISCKAYACTSSTPRCRPRPAALPILNNSTYYMHIKHRTCGTKYSSVISTMSTEGHACDGAVSSDCAERVGNTGSLVSDSVIQFLLLSCCKSYMLPVGGALLHLLTDSGNVYRPFDLRKVGSSMSAHLARSRKLAPKSSYLPFGSSEFRFHSASHCSITSIGMPRQSAQLSV